MQGVSRRGLMFVLSSPSGAGKTTLSRKLLTKQTSERGESKPSIVMSVSATTRPRRPNEANGIDYFFVSQEEFDRMIVAGEMLEYAQVFGHYYGTPAGFVQQHLAQGIDVLFDIDWQGTRQLAERNRGDMASVFILPPSMAELERRLHARAQDSAEVVKLRMEKAADEISHWQEYDYVVVNDDLDASLRTIESVLEVERRKRVRQLWLPEFVEKL